ncbi:ROK family transcriptional regulator [Arthrobacter sp. fls2-241-R2A-200]|uniref:ROK family transcriptional regulator n=1 Tax=Arthrobacter sp. fls2-241-R2A-200 TaxID=3040281 RepID=UPI00254FB522|nr:ROK family transcriptional regulator [Arthrobacter sp. fls2-241-R2A-200]
MNSLVQGVRATDLKRTNERVVLDDVRIAGLTTAPEIGKRTGLSKPTVGAALRTLQAAGFVSPQGFKEGRSGQAPLLWAVDEHAGLVLSGDIGTQWVRLGLCTLSGRPRGAVRERSESGSAEDVLRALDRAMSRLLKEAGAERDSVVYSVLGSPGVVDPVSGRLRHASNLPGWDAPSTLAALQELFGPHLLIMKDVYLAALGEAQARAGSGTKDFVLLSVGAGVGAAVVLGGQPMPGAHGLAGEIAFLPLRVDPVESGDPSPRGPLEEAASVDALLSAADAGHRFAGVHEVVQATKLGDPAATQALAAESRLIAYALTALILVVDPPLVVLTGSIGLQGGPELADAVRDDVTRLLTVSIPPVEVSTAGEAATLHGAESKAIELAWDRLAAGL